jgi:deoxyribodipyrimidine photo-lyase
LPTTPRLSAALDAAETVLPVYLSGRLEDEGEWAPGGASRWWLHHSAWPRWTPRYSARGSRLLLRAGPALDAMLAGLVAETGAQAVFWNRLYDPLVAERDAAIKQRLREMGLAARSFKAGVLHEPWELNTAAGDPYRVFTPFWKAAQSRG